MHSSHVRYRLVYRSWDKHGFYERVLLRDKPCIDHSTVITAGGQEVVVHDSELLDPTRRVLTLHRYHMQESQ